jgi:hypothetical protein
MLGERSTEAEVNAMITDADIDGDRQISYDGEPHRQRPERNVMANPATLQNLKRCVTLRYRPPTSLCSNRTV